MCSTECQHCTPSREIVKQQLAPVAGFITVAGGAAICYFAAPLFGAGEPRARRTFTFTTGIYNYGYLSLPIAQARFQVMWSRRV